MMDKKKQINDSGSTIKIVGIKSDTPIPLNRHDFEPCKHDFTPVIHSTGMRFNHHNVLLCVKDQMMLPRLNKYIMVREENGKEIRYPLWGVVLENFHVGNEGLDFQYHDKSNAMESLQLLTAWLSGHHEHRTIMLPIPSYIEHGIEICLDVEEDLDDAGIYDDGYYHYRLTINNRLTLNEHQS